MSKQCENFRKGMSRYGVPAKESEVPPKEVVDYYARGKFEHVIPPSTKMEKSDYVSDFPAYLRKRPILPTREETQGEEKWII